MKIFALAVLLALLVPMAQAQIVVSDSAKYVPATTWDSVYVGQGGLAREVDLGFAHISGNSIFAVAVGNDTSVAGKKRLYIYPSSDTQWFGPIRALFLRRRAIGGDSAVVQTYITVH